MGEYEEESDPTRLQMGMITQAAQGRKDGRNIRQEMGGRRGGCAAGGQQPQVGAIIWEEEVALSGIKGRTWGE